MKNIITKQADKMIEKYNLVKEIPFPKEETIEIDDIHSYKDFNNYFDEKNKDYSIYVISAKEFRLNDEQVKNRFKKLKIDFQTKNKGKKYCISRINEENFRKKNNSIIYVGSKEKGIKDRIKQHLGLNNSRSTYSLYMKDWWPKNKVKIKIQIWSFDEVLNNKNLNKYDMLVILEDLIWEENKPLFGQKGAPFKKSKT